MLTITPTYEILKALKMPDVEISKVLAKGDSLIVLTPAELRGKKEKWKLNSARLQRKVA